MSSLKKDDTSSLIPPGRFSGLWKEQTYSDVLIRLASDTSATESIAPYREFPAHKFVLMAGSSFFKGLLTTGQEMADQNVPVQARVSALPTTPEQALQVIEIPCENEEDADAIESVLSFLYSHTLPASPTVEALCKATTTADYLGADVCVKACAIGLSTMQYKQRDVLQINNIMNVLTRTAYSSALVRKIKAAVSDCLLLDYGDVPSIIEDNDKLLSFCKLPLVAVEAWGMSDKLKVDSENSVVVVLNNWWHNQPEEARTPECKTCLTGLVRPLFLSTSYLWHVLDKLEWFVAPFANLSFACTIINQSGFNCVDFDFLPYNKLVKQPRCRTSPRRLTLKWRMSARELQEADSSSTDYLQKGPQGYWQGHLWSLNFQVVNGKGDAGVKKSVKVGVTKHSPGTMPAEMPASADIELREDPFTVKFRQPLFNAEFPACWYQIELEGVVSGLQKHFSNDQCLLITATVSNVH